MGVQWLPVRANEDKAVLVDRTGCGELGGLVTAPVGEEGEGVGVESDVASAGARRQSGELELIADER